MWKCRQRKRTIQLSSSPTQMLSGRVQWITVLTTLMPRLHCRCRPHTLQYIFNVLSAICDVAQFLLRPTGKHVLLQTPTRSVEGCWVFPLWFFFKICCCIINNILYYHRWPAMMVIPFWQPAIVWICLCIVFIDMANKFSLSLFLSQRCCKSKL